jgi:hypothetical protein
LFPINLQKSWLVQLISRFSWTFQKFTHILSFVRY